MDESVLEGIQSEIQSLLSTRDKTNAPINRPELPYNKEPFHPTERRIQAPIEEKHEGWLRGLYEEAKEYNSLAQYYEAYDKRQRFNFLERAPDNWKSTDNWTLFENSPYIYWSMLADAKGPLEQQKRYDWIQEKVARMKEHQERSWLQTGLAFVLGQALDPWNAVPFAKTAQYVKYGTHIKKAVMGALPSIAATAIGHESIKYALDPDERIQDAAMNAFVDTLAGTFLVGMASGLGRGYTGGKLWDARRSQELAQKGIGAKLDVNDKGQITGYKADPISDSSVGAAETEINSAQEFLNAQFDRTGLFWLPVTTKAASVVSPIVKGTSSEFKTIAALVNRTASFSFNTIGGKKYVPDQNPFEERVMKIQQAAIIDQHWIEGKRAEYNGINPDGTEKTRLQKLKGKFEKEDPLDQEAFGNVVAATMLEGIEHSNPIINEVANYVRKRLDSAMIRYQRAMDFPEEILKSITSEFYFPQHHNRTQMRLRQDEWLGMAENEVRRQKQIADDLMTPINNVKESIDVLEKNILEWGHKQEGTELLELHREDLKQAKAQLKKLRNELVNKLRDDPKLNILLEERNLLTTDEAQGLKKVLEPVTKIDKERKKIQKEISELKQRKSSLKSQITKKQPEGKNEKVIAAHYQKLKDEMKAVEKEIEKKSNTVLDLDTKHANEMSSLEDEARAGNINPAYYRITPKTKKVYFRDPNALPKFRKFFEDDADLKDQVLGMYNKILGLSDEEVMTNRFLDVANIVSESPTKKRSIMLDSKVLLDNGFLKTDLPGMTYNYQVGLGKISAMEESLENFGAHYTKEGDYIIEESQTAGEARVLASLQNEYKEKFAQIQAKNLPEKKRVKAITKLENKYRKETEFAKAWIDNMLGRSRAKAHPDIREAANAMRNLAAATRLGNVPLTQVTDMAANSFKHGLYRFIRDGISPAVKTMNGWLKSKDAKHYRRVSSEANLGFEHVHGALTRRMYGYDTFRDEEARTKIGAGLKKAANWSQNFSLTNYIENFNQIMSANIVQSKIVEYMHSYKAGKLSKKKHREMMNIGIDPEKWANRIVDQTSKFGKKGVFGGYQSYYFDWDDIQALNKMSDAIFTGTRDTIIKKGLGDAPLLLQNNEAISLFTQFMGWSFAAFNRYGVPLMQSADARMVAGTALMAMTASMEGITRKISRGEEVDLDDENFFAEAFGNSPATAMIYKATMNANAFLDIDFLNKLQNDKYAGVLKMGALGGPGIGVINDLYQMAQMFTKGDLNKKQFTRGVLAVPGIQAWHSRWIENAFIDAVTQGWPEKPTPKE